jgi:hypothetical protein
MPLSKQKVSSIESPYIRLAKIKRAEEVQREPSHCLNYDLSHCIEKPEPYALQNECDSRDGGHMKGFRNNKVSNILRGS